MKRENVGNRKGNRTKQTTAIQTSAHENSICMFRYSKGKY